MKQRPRIYYSDTQKALMWDRWEKGDSMHAIARLFDRGHGSIQRILSETGGIRPLPRSRSRLSLTSAAHMPRAAAAFRSVGLTVTPVSPDSGHRYVCTYCDRDIIDLAKRISA